MRERASAFEGMQETLQELKAQGFKLAICSNAFPDHIDHVLEAIRLARHQYSAPNETGLNLFL